MSSNLPQLDETRRRLDEWLREAALPIWATVGFDAPKNLFQEALTAEGLPLAAARRSRVQTRLIWSFMKATGAELGAYAATAARAYEAYLVRYRRPDGAFCRTLGRDGLVVDPTPALYEQAFSLLAIAAMDDRERAAEMRSALGAYVHAAGGYREYGEQPYQANAQMHLLEAALDCEVLGHEWTAVADEVAELALDRLIDGADGFLREFFDASWRPLPDDAGGLIEPGHQFEWAWLLHRWGTRRGRPMALTVAERLYGAGLRGVDPDRGVAVGAMWSNGQVRESTAQIWAQTEWLRTALVFDDHDQALRAARALWGFLETPVRGLWWDRQLADGSFVVEPSRGTALYHVLGAALPLLGKAPPT